MLLTGFEAYGASSLIPPRGWPSDLPASAFPDAATSRSGAGWSQDAARLPGAPGPAPRRRSGIASFSATSRALIEGY
jgi:hypothetical protein